MNAFELDSAIRESDEICDALGEKNVYMALIKLDKMVRQQEARISGLAAVQTQIIEDRNGIEQQLASAKYTMRESARTLAAAGNYAHKQKNESILRVISWLLSSGSNDNETGGMDDIPF